MIPGEFEEGKIALSPISQPRLLSFTLDSWTALGGEISISLRDQIVVLVGRNGAGKSAILEGFEAVSSWAVGKLGRFKNLRQFDIDSIPKRLKIEVSTPTDRQLQYSYEIVVLPPSSDELGLSLDDSSPGGSEESQYSWNDRCQYMDGEQEILWTTEMGVTTFRDGNVTILGSTHTLRSTNLSWSENPARKQWDEMQWIYTVLSEVRLLGKTPMRQAATRYRSLLPISGKRLVSHSVFPFQEVDRLARQIIRLKSEELHELEEICQRIGLGEHITIQKFFAHQDIQETTEPNHEEYIASVLFDGVNIGLLSDGTLRILKLLIELIISPLCATTIIEEPETQIHPGMLAKLLNEIETYTFGQNLVISTQSPQVVSWTSPDKINWVYRDQGRTIVQKLDADQIQKIHEYLCEEGDLGEWLYSGILDD